jgi:hypothetical protein
MDSPGRQPAACLLRGPSPAGRPDYDSSGFPKGVSAIGSIPTEGQFMVPLAAVTTGRLSVTSSAVSAMIVAPVEFGHLVGLRLANGRQRTRGRKLNRLHAGEHRNSPVGPVHDGQPVHVPGDSRCPLGAERAGHVRSATTDCPTGRRA